MSINKQQPHYEAKEHISHGVNSVFFELGKRVVGGITKILGADSKSLKLQEIQSHMEACDLKFGKPENGETYIFVTAYGYEYKEGYSSHLEMQNRIMSIKSTKEEVLKRKKLLNDLIHT